MTQFCTLQLDSLFNIPLYAVFAYRNDQDKKIYLTYSQETLLAIARNTVSIKNGSHSCRGLVKDRDKLKIEIVESIEDRNNLKLRYEYWVDYYRNLGYTMYRNYKSVSYSVRIAIESLKEVLVYLVNGRNDKTLVGRFDTLREAKAWSKATYPVESKIYRIIYHESMKNRIEDESEK